MLTNEAIDKATLEANGYKYSHPSDLQCKTCGKETLHDEYYKRHHIYSLCRTCGESIYCDGLKALRYAGIMVK